MSFKPRLSFTNVLAAAGVFVCLQCLLETRDSSSPHPAPTCCSTHEDSSLLLCDFRVKSLFSRTSPIIITQLKDVITLRTGATGPVQILNPLAFLSDSNLYWVESPKPLFSEEEQASIWAGQCPVCPPWHASPICEPARVVMLLNHGSEVQHKIAGPLEDDHVTQRSIIEGTVGMMRETQVSVLLWETGIQHITGIAPHPLPCTPWIKRVMSQVVLFITGGESQ